MQFYFAQKSVSNYTPLSKRKQTVNITPGHESNDIYGVQIKWDFVDNYDSPCNYTKHNKAQLLVTTRRNCTSSTEQNGAPAT